MIEQTTAVRRRLDLAEAAVIGDDALPMLLEMIALAGERWRWVGRLSACRDMLRVVRDEMRREAEVMP